MMRPPPSPNRLVVLITTLFAAPCAAQQAPATFHVYVDPIFGDDAMAFHMNPNTTGPIERRPMADYPANFPDQGNTSLGLLQHAPYSFRTLSGGAGPNDFGALAYINTVFPEANGPWINEETGGAIHWIVIHCLPGLYGPDSTIDPNLSDFDTGVVGIFGSQYRYNGEAFPIELRNGVNIQGTSALDTVFDARGRTTAIFRAWDPDYTGPTFVDSLTVRGAVSNGDPAGDGLARNDSGAGFSIRHWMFESSQNSHSLTISNCFITQNSVGIAIENSVRASPDIVATPVIVNNTIAWNEIGIWSGNSAMGEPKIAVAQPVILNNILDPGAGEGSLFVPFLGVHPWDLSVVLSGQVTPMNAYPRPANYSGSASVSNYLAGDAGLRAPVMPYSTPRVDLSLYMPQGRPRGVLYVCDACRVAGEAPELWFHDLRLAPHTVQDPTGLGPTNPISEKNPLVNMGMAIGSGGLSQITMANHTNWWRNYPAEPSPGNQVVNQSPGFHPAQPEPDRFHAWDWDCEGFGNPRVRARDGFQNWPGGATLSNIDLGADEMDQLIIAGYAPRTRMFTRFWYEALQPDITKLIFFDLRGSLHRRPLYNYWLGLENQGGPHNWWLHTLFPNQVGGQCVDCIQVNSSWTGNYPSNYTDVATPTSIGALRERKIRLLNPGLNVPIPASAQGPIMRNLECDFSPSLMLDFHPYWGHTWMIYAGQGQFAGDFYAANPWFGT